MLHRGERKWEMAELDQKRTLRRLTIDVRFTP
jgi:hypothetical protein